MPDEYIGKNSAFTATADAIREKGKSTESIVWDEETGFEQAVLAIKGGIDAALPNFTYEDGVYSVELDGDNWKVKFLTSATFISEKDILVDVFAVGGGGGGTPGSNLRWEGCGGGGGYTVTVKSVLIYAGTPYDIVIGDGGAGAAYVSGSPTSSIAGDGGRTSGFGAAANGGKGGNVLHSTSKVYSGGAGGSGGGAWSGAGGEDGENGLAGNGFPTDATGGGGTGQGTTTREFGETDGTLYSTGGGSGTGTDGEDNTGHGGMSRNHNLTLNGGYGGSGILIIRNARDVE